MAKYFTLFITFLIITGTLISQPVIDNTKMPQIGDTYTYNDCDTVGIKPGSSGASQSWDFSTVSKKAQNMITVIDPKNGIKADKYSNATIAFGLDTATQYYTSSSNKLERMGMAFADGEEILSNFETALQFPLAFSDKISDVFSGVFNITMSGELYEMKRGGKVDIEADAWGTVKLPQGNFANVLRTKTIKYEYDTMNVMGLNVYRTIFTTTYSWLSTKYKFPIFSITYVKSTQTMMGNTTTTLVGSVQLSNAAADGGTTVNPPGLLSPSNGAQNLTIPVNLSWNAVTIAKKLKDNNIQAGTEYTVEYSENNQFSPVISSVKTANTNLEISNISGGKTYFWRVKATVNSIESNWSETFSFSTKPLSTTTPILSEPADGSSTNLTPILKWSKDANAVKWRIRVGTDLNITNPIISEENLTQNLYPITNQLNPGTKYYWKADASNGTDWAGWSSVWNFTTSTDGVSEEILVGDDYISIFPNPAIENVTIIITDNNSIIDQVDIIDIKGITVQEFDSQNSNLNIDVKSITAGKYFVRIKSGNKYYINSFNIAR